MENPSERNTTSRKEAQERIRLELQRRREEARRLNQAEENERKREQAFMAMSSASSSSPASSPASSPSQEVSSTESDSAKNAGWDQGDGRRADQVVVYEGALPDAIRARLEPAKGTHFRFRKPSDEQALLEALSSAGQSATYQPTGKKDITITSADGHLLGNIHFLHMDGRNIHRPEKYYMKFYLFNFSDANTLRDVKQRLLHFVQSFTAHLSHSRARPGSSSRPRSHSRHNRHHKTVRHAKRWRPTRKNKMRRSLK